MTKTFKILPDLTCPELAGYKLPELPRRQEDDVEKQYSEELDKRWAIAKNYKGQVAGRHPDAFSREEMKGMIRGYMEAREKFIFPMETIDKIREVLCNGIATNMSMASAIVEFDKIVYNQLAPRHPIAIEVEMERVVHYSATGRYNDFVVRRTDYKIVPATHPDGTVKGVWVYE